MAFVKIIQSLGFMPKAYKHLCHIKKQLQQTSYDGLLNQTVKPMPKKIHLESTVKSYFWSCRLIPNCDCLLRSIALYQMLRANAYDVQHKLGVNKLHGKLKAHAWVEHKSKPLNEHPDLLKRFKVLEKDNN